MAPAVSAKEGWLTKIESHFSSLMLFKARPEKSDWQMTVAKVQSIPDNMQAGVVAATVSAEGHWTFANGKGELFTAANDREMETMADALFPEGTSARGVVIYLSSVAVFQHRAQLKNLPASARLYLVSGDRSYLLQSVSTQTEKDQVLYAQVRPDVIVALSQRDLFEELVWQLERPLPQDRTRVLSIVRNGPATFSARRPVHYAKSDMGVDRIASQHLIAALPALSEQLAILTGRIDGNDFIIRTGDGGEVTRNLENIRQVAVANDIGLVLLNSKSPRQPGSRNWLLQRVDVNGLNAALESATVADFIGSLALAANKVEVRGTPPKNGRLRLIIAPIASNFIAPAGGLAGLISELASEVAGTVMPQTAQLDFPDRLRAEELSRRVLPGIPSVLQFGFAAVFVIGLIGIKAAWNWWRTIWPAELRNEYGNWFGYQAARGIRFLLFIVFFLPAAGTPAVIWLIYKIVAKPFVRSSKNMQT